MTSRSSRSAAAQRTGLSVGASSILVVFVLLCLVTFAVLSLVSARADKALSDKHLAHLTEYYTAETALYAQLSGVDATLQACREASTEDYFAQCERALQNADTPLTQEEGGYFVTLEQPVNERQTLVAKLRLLSPEEVAQDSSSGWYRIFAWQVVGEGDWMPDDELPVYGKSGALPGGIDSTEGGTH